MNKTEIINDLINYYAGMKMEHEYTDEQREIIALSNREWEKLPCDKEGATKEQWEEQDRFLDKTAEKVMKVK